MPGTEKLPHNLMPSVIVKFVHFDNKHKVYMARRLIAKTSNPLNGKKIYINERLPPLEARLRDEVSKMGYLTSSNNCVVSIKFAKHDGRTGYAPIKHINDCEKVRGAIKLTHGKNLNRTIESVTYRRLMIANEFNDCMRVYHQLKRKNE